MTSHFYFFSNNGTAALLEVPASASSEDWTTLQQTFYKLSAPLKSKREEYAFVGCFKLWPDQYRDGVFWDEELAGPDGVSVLLLPMPFSTQDDVRKVSAYLRHSRDVVRMRVESVTRWLPDGSIPEQRTVDQVFKGLIDQNDRYRDKLTRQSPRLKQVVEAAIVSSGYQGDVARSHKLMGDLGMDSLDTVEFVMELEDAFDIAIPDDAWDQLTDATIQSVLDYLDDRLGPEFPTDQKYLKLTESQFIDRYGPEKTSEGDYYRQREWDGKDDELIRQACRERRCWTAIESDGWFSIEWGNLVVNRLYNIITSKPIENEAWAVSVQDPDDRERVKVKVGWGICLRPGPDAERPPHDVEVLMEDIADFDPDDEIGSYEEFDKSNVGHIRALTNYLRESYGYDIKRINFDE